MVAQKTTAKRPRKTLRPTTGWVVRHMDGYFALPVVVRYSRLDCMAAFVGVSTTDSEEVIRERWRKYSAEGWRLEKIAIIGHADRRRLRALQSCARNILQFTKRRSGGSMAWRFVERAVELAKQGLGGTPHLQAVATKVDQ